MKIGVNKYRLFKNQVFKRVSYYYKHNNNLFEETTTTNNKTNTTDAASWHNRINDVIVSNLNLFLTHELASVRLK